ncbi:MAG: hypothetical protein LUO95_00415 [Methylococcaceae bacterium]|nr:hypothetical protein [Methylococcaceae bacterium]MDD1607377.1 hypothetical protein [Methylococcaceae bacterium]MDD1609097.1 hypothetical protein [Methylococcaceae bacterium]MDD1615708.1 hypothetical protein [Methylococcaceae bacterium]OYV19615.1 MAG: hypothetical protein CG439_802 [Methylococcaceae bacterium NSP1-2]
MRNLFLIFTLVLWTQLLFAADVYDTYHNDRFDYSIDYPKDVLFPQGESDNGDGQKFLSKDADASLIVYGSNNALNQSLEEVYREESRGGTAENPKKVVTYKLLEDNWFVVSGYNSGRVFYQKTIFHDDMLKTFVLEYDESQKAFYDPIAKRLATSFTD